VIIGIVGIGESSRTPGVSPASCGKIRQNRQEFSLKASRLHRSRLGGRQADLAEDPGGHGPGASSSASPTASDAYHVRQSPCDTPCIQAIQELSSTRVPSSSQASQRPFSEKAGLSGSLSDSCAVPENHLRQKGEATNARDLDTLSGSELQACRTDVGTAADFDGDGLTRQESRRFRRFDTWRSFGFCRNSSKGNNP